MKKSFISATLNTIFISNMIIGFISGWYLNFPDALVVITFTAFFSSIIGVLLIFIYGNCVGE